MDTGGQPVVGSDALQQARQFGALGRIQPRAHRFIVIPRRLPHGTQHLAARVCEP